MDYIPKPTQIAYVKDFGTYVTAYAPDGQIMFMAPKSSPDDKVHYGGGSLSVSSGNITRIYGPDGRITGLAP